jgi:hypothetical protein
MDCGCLDAIKNIAKMDREGKGVIPDEEKAKFYKHLYEERFGTEPGDLSFSSSDEDDFI